MSTHGHGSNGNGHGRPKAGPRISRDAVARPLPKRFYTTAAAAQTADGRWRLELDGRAARTPGKRELAMAIAGPIRAVAEEWSAQGVTIDPAAMPLTRLLNSAIDGVAGREVEVAADIVAYAQSDLLCYRADRPAGLVDRQAALWDPVLAWARTRHGLELTLQSGLMPVQQPGSVAERITAVLAGADAFRIAALHVMTTLTGSALLPLAVADRQLTPEAAWTAAHVDEDWQIAEWGEDAEAQARRAARWRDMVAAARLLELLEGP
jgi:chaperone required for assembly of F1-ATPase